MPSPVYTSLTAGELAARLALRVGDRKYEGTASSGSATTIVDTSADSELLKFATTDDPLIIGGGKMVSIYKGTNAGAVRRPTALNTSTVTLTVPLAFASAIDSTSQFFGNERWTLNEFLLALYEAQRRITWDPGLEMGILKEAVGREIQIGNALLNPVFDLYTTANAPDSWTTTNLTVTQETTVTYGGCRRSLKVVTDGVNVSNLRQSLGEVGRYPASFVAEAWIWCETASEVFLRVNDGVDDHDSSKHKGTGWEKLTVTVTPSALAGKGTDAMTVAIRTTTAASAITYYVQQVWVPIAPGGDHVYALNSSINLVAIEGTLRVSGKFGVGGGATGRFNEDIAPASWEIVYESTRKIRLHIETGYEGCILEYRGWANHAALTAIGTTWAGPIDAILDMAEAILHAEKVAPQQVPSLAQAATPGAQDVRDAVRKAVLMRDGVKLPAGSKLVEPIR